MRCLFLIIGICIPIFLYGQINNSAIYNLNDSLPIHRGIYLSKNQFLSNSPAISYDFDIVRKIEPMSVFTWHGESFFLEYFDILGNRISKPLTDVWAFCNSRSLYFCYEGRPFRVHTLGSFSVLTYFDEFIESENYNVYAKHVWPYFSKNWPLTEFVFMNFKDEIFVRANHKNLEKMLLDMSLLPFKLEYDSEILTIDEALPIIAKFNIQNPLKIELPKEISNKDFLSVDYNR